MALKCYRDSGLVGTAYAEYCRQRRLNEAPKADEDCHLCGGRSQGSGGRHHQVVVDHCHQCGIIRGVLCLVCNRRMRSCDLAAANFASVSDWRFLRPARRGRPAAIVVLTQAERVERVIRDVHRMLDRHGATAVFAYQNHCVCPPTDGGNDLYSGGS